MTKLETAKKIQELLDVISKCAFDEMQQISETKKRKIGTADWNRCIKINALINEIVKREEKCQKDGEEPSTSTSTQAKSNGAEK